MKPASRHSIRILFGLILLLSLSGCGKDDKKNNNNPLGPVNQSLVGTWQTQKIIALGVLVYTPESEEFVFIKVVLKSDNTLTYERTEKGETTTGTGTWSATSTNATIQLSDGTTLSGSFALNEDETVLTVQATLPVDLTPADTTDPKTNVPATIEFLKVN